jgi:serine/threonine protein kinase
VAQNKFGICLECGHGVQRNQALAAEFFRRAACQGHVDAANNFGLCLEYGRGVSKDISCALGYYKFAADRDHVEAILNYNRLLRLCGRWETSKCVTDIALDPTPDLDLARLFLCCSKPEEATDDASSELFSSIARLKAGRKRTVIPVISIPICTKLPDCSGNSSDVFFRRTADGSVNAVKKPWASGAAELLEREIAIHAALQHPLVLAFRGRGKRKILTECAGNGSLAHHLPPLTDFKLSPLRRPTRIARVIVGMALAMRYLDSRDVVHRDLCPENVLLDWKWNVQIADFGHSLSPDWPTQHSNDVAYMNDNWPSIKSGYLAPEVYKQLGGSFSQKSDVFSFALILYELVVGCRVFSKELRPQVVARKVAIDHFRPEIPEFVLSEMSALICDCWEDDPDDRPCFEDIVDRLEDMKFKVVRGVKSWKVKSFVDAIKEQESKK